MVIGRTVGLVSSVGRAHDLQAGLGGCWMHVSRVITDWGSTTAKSATFFRGDIFNGHSPLPLIQEGLLSDPEDKACLLKHFKTLLFKNHWIYSNIIWRKGLFGDPLPRLIKPCRFVKKLTASWEPGLFYL